MFLPKKRSKQSDNTISSPLRGAPLSKESVKNSSSSQEEVAQAKRSDGGDKKNPQCRGRPMFLPKKRSKRKKYSSTASGPTGSPSVMIEGRCGTIASFATTKHLCFQRSAETQ
ncbi:MAG: hypothetical protein IJY98_00030 [Bacteroidaceae bacterium]|nr:hypothetical protein [Bacteroidaceae bacterium]